MLSTFASADAPDVPVQSARAAHPAGRHARHADLQRDGGRPPAHRASPSITNTASTTSAQFPIAISASVTNIVANPSVLSASVGDRVWLDADGDGLQDIGEPGIANVEVTLKDQCGTPVAITDTDVNGRYLLHGRRRPGPATTSR